MRDAPSNIYLAAFIGEGDPAGFCKIGVAEKPEARRREMQTGSPFTLAIVGRWQVGRTYREAVAAEMMIHASLTDYRVRGEWFRLTAADATAHIERLLKNATAFTWSDGPRGGYSAVSVSELLVPQ